jgi:hypothetical protein
MLYLSLYFANPAVCNDNRILIKEETGVSDKGYPVVMFSLETSGGMQ